MTNILSPPWRKKSLVTTEEDFSLVSLIARARSNPSWLWTSLLSSETLG